MVNLHVHTWPDTTGRWRPGGPHSGLEEVVLCCGHPGLLLGGCGGGGGVSVCCSRRGLRNHPALLSDAVWLVWSVTQTNQSEVSLQKAISCLLLQRQQVAFMSRPLYPQQNQRRLKKSDTSRDLPSKLRCEDKACLKVCFLLRSCSCWSQTAGAKGERRPGAPLLKSSLETLAGVMRDRREDPSLQRGSALARPHFSMYDGQKDVTGQKVISITKLQNWEARLSTFSSPSCWRKKRAPTVKVIKPFRVW